MTTSRQLSTARASFKMALSGDDDDAFYGDVMSNTFAGTQTHTYYITHTHTHTHTHTCTRVFSLSLSRSLSHTHPTNIQTFSFALSIFFSNTVCSILSAFDDATL